VSVLNPSAATGTSPHREARGVRVPDSPRRGRRRAGPLVRAVLCGALLGGALLGLPGCNTSPAQQEATREAWAARDAERAQECAQKNGRFIAGGCNFGGGQ